MNDTLLVAALQRGDRAAFETLMREHQQAVYAYLRSRLLEASDAEDLAQEVFLRSYQSRARFDDQILIRPWLLGIARNLLREHVRRVKRRKEVAWTELCLELESLIETEDPRHEDLVGYLPDCLVSLGPSARQALELRYREQLRLDKIGERLLRSEGAVKLLMFRARQAIKLCLEGRLRGDA